MDFALSTRYVGFTEEQYPALRSYLPGQRGNVANSHPAAINAIIHVAETGCAWRALPERLGKRYMIYTRMRRCADAGVLGQLFDGLQEHYGIRVRIESLGLDRITPKIPP